MTRAHAAGTIGAHNYAAQARILARSYMEHHPDHRFYTLIIDGSEPDRAQEGLGTVVLPEDLPVDAADLSAMRAMYDVMEYATALKPAFLLHLHHLNSLTATYLDPDIRVYAPMGDVAQAALRGGIALTPHTLQPVPRDGLSLREADIAHAGMYNLGFIATGPAALRFLVWWHERLKTDAVVDLANALFTDQRWVDWAPALESVEILRDPGLNAAYWNAHEREITRDDDGRWRAGGVPLRFFHFSGYDPATPWVFSTHMGTRPRTLLSQHPGLAELCTAYGSELVAVGHPELKREPYRHAVTPAGVTLTPEIRRILRDELTADDGQRPPDPFNESWEFVDWLTRATPVSGGHAFTRIDDAIWRARPDLRSAFPDPAGSSAPGFRAWLDREAFPGEMYRSIGLAPPPPAPASGTSKSGARTPAAWGWSVAGYARAELGVGEAARRLALAVEQTGVPWEMVGLTEGSRSRQQHAFVGELRARPRFDNVILCVNADQTARVLDRWLLPSGGRRIGYWFWELERFPDGHERAFELLDEIWMSTEFIRASVAARTDKPVRVVPMPVPVPALPTRLVRRDLGMPEDAFVFTTSFDYLSVMRRKNPLAAIAAFRDAFAPGDGAALLVKSINGHLRPYDREEIRAAAVGRPDIVLHEDYMTSFEVRSLIELSDAFVSLHRSEGYGLNLADAMALGTPVVATAYSGNMEFMSQGSAQLVGYDLVEVGRAAEPYDPTAHWAEPRHDEAAAAMRELFESPALAANVAAAARRHIECYSSARIAAALTPVLLSPLSQFVKAESAR